MLPRTAHWIKMMSSLKSCEMLRKQVAKAKQAVVGLLSGCFESCRLVLVIIKLMSTLRNMTMYRYHTAPPSVGSLLFYSEQEIILHAIQSKSN